MHDFKSKMYEYIEKKRKENPQLTKNKNNKETKWKKL
jgi:hypothetical protein